MAVGAIFISSDNMSTSIAKIFGNAEDVMEMASNDGQRVNIMKNNVVVFTGSTDGKTGNLIAGNNYQMTFYDKNNKMYVLAPNSTYEFTIDTSKAVNLDLTGDDPYRFTAQLFVNNSDGTYTKLLDSPRNTLTPQGSQSALLANNKYYNGPDKALALMDGNGTIYATSNGSNITYTIATGDQALSLGGNIVHQKSYAALSDEDRASIGNFIEEGFSLKKVK